MTMPDGPDAPEDPPEEEAEEETSDNESIGVAPEARIRRLSMPEQLKLARTSPSLTDRTILERMLGRSGWELLLSNPNLTSPEVARIARKGTVPLPLIEKIVQTRRWLEAPNVRRALLSNPKLSQGLIQQVLRATPAHELKLVPKQTAYPRPVRMVASRMLGQ
ncbi:MAG: hypothetical protein AB7S26_35050 [Sandaracinaceae bacterium]